MKWEIDNDFYCSADAFTKENIEEQQCCFMGSCEGYDCLHKHRKHPTPEQFKEEYGEEWTGAIYVLWGDEWRVLADKKVCNDKSICVCACTPFGKPDNSWRPQ